MAFYTDIPFVAILKIVPNRATGKRLEIVRAREKLAAKVYEQVRQIPEFTIAEPGGSGYRSQLTDSGAPSTLESTAAIRPQFGQEPDTVVIVGFYRPDSPVTGSPFKDTTIFNDNTVKTGPVTFRGYLADGSLDPSDDNKSLTLQIKTLIENYVDTSIKLVRLEVQGVLYGHGGFHFPSA